MSALGPLSDDARHIRDELIAAQPDGGEVLLDWDDPDGPGGETEADARVLDVAGVQVVRKLRREVSPLTAEDGLPIWERSLGLAGSKIATHGTIAQRQAQVVSKLREGGPPTLARIRDVLNAYLQYADPSEIQILEVDRDALRTMHTYLWRGSKVVDAVGVSLPFDVPDDAAVAAPGPQVDLGLNCGDLSLLSAGLRAPDGTVVSVGVVRPAGRGSSTSPRTFILQPSGLTVRALAALAADQLWAVGTGGAAARWDGSTWTALTTGVVTDLYGVTAVKYTALGVTFKVLWAVGAGGVILQGNGNTGTWSGVMSPTADDLLAVAAVSRTAAMAVGKNWAVALWDGTSWSTLAKPGLAAGDATCVARVGAKWWVGDTSSEVWSYDGAAWTREGTLGQPVRGIWAAGEGDVWLVGDTGAAAHVGTSWTYYTAHTEDLTAVWGDSRRTETFPQVANSVWAVGKNGAVAYWNGSTWAAYPTPTASTLYAVLGTAPDDVWIAGVDAAHYTAGTGGAIRLYFPDLAGKAVAGRWTLDVIYNGTALLTDAGLFVEGVGLDSTGRDGRGGIKFLWAVLVDSAKLGTGYDLDAAQAAVDRICYATRRGQLVLKGAGAGGAAIPDTPSATPGMAIPG